MKNIPTARDIMTARPLVLPFDTPVREAAGRLVKKHILSAPVVDADGKFAGIFSQVKTLTIADPMTSGYGVSSIAPEK